jgi:argininosuccinate lyase
LFDTFDTVQICLEVMARLLGEISFDKERLNEAIQKGFLVATDLADYLVRKGVPFRQAHEIVGKMVLLAISQKKELHELTLKELKGFYRQIGQDVYEWLDPMLSPGRRNSPGGTAPDRVKQEIEKAKQELGMGDEERPDSP